MVKYIKTQYIYNIQYIIYIYIQCTIYKYTIYFKIEDGAELKTISPDAYDQKYNWVPIKMIEKDIKINKEIRICTYHEKAAVPFHAILGLNSAQSSSKNVFKHFCESFDLIKQKRFSSDQIYFALSRRLVFNVKI